MNYLHRTVAVKTTITSMPRLVASNWWWSLRRHPTAITTRISALPPPCPSVKSSSLSRHQLSAIMPHPRSLAHWNLLAAITSVWRINKDRSIISKTITTPRIISLIRRSATKMAKRKERARSSWSKRSQSSNLWVQNCHIKVIKSL